MFGQHWVGQCDAARSSAEHGEGAERQLALAHCWLLSVSELMPRLAGLPGTGMVWYRSLVQTQVVFGATNHRKQSLPEECLPSVSRNCQHWQGVSGATSLTLSQRVLRPVCFSGVS